MALFKNKYRVQSTRLKGWDYAGAGWYFVTICTRNMEKFFGEIVKDEMQLSAVGEIVANEWVKTPSIRPQVSLDEWIVMPNHLHGILVIASSPIAETSKVETSRRDVSTGSTKPQLKAGSLGAMIGQIKSVSTKQIWQAGYGDFAWQSRFYDHIIRDEKSLEKIREYIRNNPLNWEHDRNKSPSPYS